MQFAAAREGFDLVTVAAELKDHQVDFGDPANRTRLLVGEKQLEDLLTRFSGRAGRRAGAVRWALGRFETALRLRDQTSREYNVLANELCRVYADIVRTREDLEHCRAALVEDRDPARERYLEFVDGAWLRARDACLRQLYLMQRAIWHRTLRRPDGLLDLGESIDLTSITAREKGTQVAEALQAALDDAGTPPQRFPPLRHGRDHWGQLVRITDEEVLADLVDEGEVDILLDGRSADLRDEELDGLRDMCDVRIRTVRAWLVPTPASLDPNRYVELDLVHNGIETFYDRQGAPHPFRHDHELVRRFKYREGYHVADLAGPSGHFGGSHTDGLDNDDLLARYGELCAGIELDGDLTGGTDAPLYALVSPFATWTLRRRGGDDLPELAAIVFEFHGDYYGIAGGGG